MSSPETPLLDIHGANLGFPKQKTLPEEGSDRLLEATGREGEPELYISLSAIKEWIKTTDAEIEQKAAAKAAMPPQIFDDVRSHITYAGEMGIYAGQRILIGQMVQALLDRISPEEMMHVSVAPQDGGGNG